MSDDEREHPAVPAQHEVGSARQGRVLGRAERYWSHFGGSPDASAEPGQRHARPHARALRRPLVSDDARTLYGVAPSDTRPRERDDSLHAGWHPVAKKPVKPSSTPPVDKASTGEQPSAKK